MLSTRRLLLWSFVAGMVLAPPGVQGQVVKLRDKLKDEHVRGAEDVWVYNDIQQGIREARRTGKPMFVTFRCVPCKACAGFDAEVAQGNARILQLARTKFVAVRQVEMKGVDLNWFQFDHDLNWAAMFVNPDGTVYARYGTQSAEGPDAYNSVEGLEATMQRVLELHGAYPRNKEELAGKRGPKRSYRTALEMPGLRRKEKYRGATARDNCIHCHNIHDAEHFHAQETGTFSEEMLWRYPLPQNLGLTIDPDHGRRITAVEEGSPADRAGLEDGEELTHVDGQVITSIADVQWALHQLPHEPTTVKVRGSRNGGRTLRLGTDWKKTDISWRGSMWSVSPRLRVWMPPLPPQKRRGLKLGKGQVPLEVRWINRGQPGGRAAFDAGLRKGDVVVAVDGRPVRQEPRQLHTWIKLNYEVGQELPLTVLRGGRQREVRVKLVE